MHYKTMLSYFPTNKIEIIYTNILVSKEYFYHKPKYLEEITVRKVSRGEIITINP